MCMDITKNKTLINKKVKLNIGILFKESIRLKKILITSMKLQK